jgi:hypothetical protein
MIQLHGRRSSIVVVACCVASAVGMQAGIGSHGIVSRHLFSIFEFENKFNRKKSPGEST